MIKSQCTDPEIAASSEINFSWLFSDRDSRDEAIALREEIKKRHNIELKERNSYWEGLSKAASLYYCSEFNIQRNNQIVKGVGLNKVNYALKAPTKHLSDEEAKLLKRLQYEAKPEEAERKAAEKAELKLAAKEMKQAMKDELKQKIKAEREAKKKAKKEKAKTEIKVKRSVALPGMKYSLLTVISRDGDKILCACDCGNYKNVNIKNLTSGRSRSCGCVGRNHWMKQEV